MMRIRAALADAHVAPLLGVAVGAPLLCVERVAFTYKDQPVGWRMSYINTGHHYYFDELNQDVMDKLKPRALDCHDFPRPGKLPLAGAPGVAVPPAAPIGAREGG